MEVIINICWLIKPKTVILPFKGELREVKIMSVGSGFVSLLHHGGKYVISKSTRSSIIVYHRDAELNTRKKNSSSWVWLLLGEQQEYGVESK